MQSILYNLHYPVFHVFCSFQSFQFSKDFFPFFIGDLLVFLKKRKPKDAFCIVGVTVIDLYPKDSWNFVFGQASLSEGNS